MSIKGHKRIETNQITRSNDDMEANDYPVNPGDTINLRRATPFGWSRPHITKVVTAIEPAGHPNRYTIRCEGVRHPLELRGTDRNDWCLYNLFVQGEPDKYYAVIVKTD